MTEQILSFLRQNAGYVSGQELSRELKISRAAIWKHIDHLRACGYDIVAVPHLGYRLESIPDKLFPWEIKNGLSTKILGREIAYHETVASTMDEAFALGVRRAAEGTVVCAEGQTKGRGRLGRTWVSPKGKGIYLSVLLRPRLPLVRVAELTLLSAVAICQAVQHAAGVAARIKWPNDILINNHKLGGILTELSAEMDRVNFIVVGIGLNITRPAGKSVPGAAFLKDIARKDFTRAALAREILHSLEMWYETIHQHGVSPVLKKWKDLSVTLGQAVRVVEPGGTIAGKAVDLADDGGLLIQTSQGRVIKKMSGDVEIISKRFTEKSGVRHEPHDA